MVNVVRGIALVVFGLFLFSFKTEMAIGLGTVALIVGGFFFFSRED